MKAEESTKAQDAWRESGAWRDMKLVAARVNGSVRTGELDDQKLGTPTVDQRLTLQLVQNANLPDSKTSSYEIGEWGSIALLHKAASTQRIDPTTWAVNWPLRVTDGAGFIRLKLKFDRAFPELENWPAK
jgi:hypothetical protein